MECTRCWVVQNELARVLYPVFVHCFLDLVDKNELPLAREFLNAFRDEHERLHGAELTRLQVRKRNISHHRKQTYPGDNPHL